MIHAFKKLPLIAQSHIDTPMGVMTALITARGLAGLWFDGQTGSVADLEVPEDDANEHAVAAREWLGGYWSGGEPDIGKLKLDMHGTLFQRAVWRELVAIGHGRTRTYGEIAQRVGEPSAARAAGAACGANPVAIIVPCHRVIGSNGSLTGYAGGLPRKLALLKHEGVLLT